MNKRQAGRLGGLRTSARNDPREYTLAARLKANSLERWKQIAWAQAQEAGKGAIEEPELTRRAVALYSEEMTRRALQRWNGTGGRGKES